MESRYEEEHGGVKRSPAVIRWNLASAKGQLGLENTTALVVDFNVFGGWMRRDHSAVYAALAALHMPTGGCPTAATGVHRDRTVVPADGSLFRRPTPPAGQDAGALP
ncbi:hypothetical protein KEM48_001907 [Puccinia striiformis f. sp. tritici PST-130]|uniref:Uncharacterized protein n=1 Tax=Puccinia striiformis f. sp. tritici PST-78 TaxID=1165861 RepID=A0A0L0VFE5_9BASI|nr:hypothetical protein H4Q26_001792 [Puccinia striiformis f. sp. tritici PST-130]KAI9606310.1 hypothetical protein KEM48_001907 [Puccinia striiformis f. sp. tritici PST-130]KNE98005.1 hypothetical protein PSTG_08679 [Puccinia striiformis f. sp. tritici PST-78]